MKKQQGFTLIELMITSLISLFLMAGIMNLFITTNKTVSLSDALSQNQETGRFAMDYLTRFIRKAGYTQNSDLSPPELMIPNPNNDFFYTCPADNSAQGNACSANNPDPDTILGDRLSIVYVADGLVESRSCSGSVIGGAGNGEQRLVDVFWVSNVEATRRELRCRTYDSLAGDWLDANPISIINNVQTFEFQVGLADDDKSKNASRYVSVDTLISEANNLRIRSLRIAILTTSTDELNENRIQTKKKVRKYGVLDAPQIDGVEKPLTFEDGNLRNLFISTIELPGSIEGAMFN